MSTKVLLTFVVSLVGLVIDNVDDESRKELKLLEASWRVTRIERFGMALPAPEDFEMDIIIKGNILTYGVFFDGMNKDPDEFNAKISINPTEMPKQIDITITTAAKKDDVGKTILGIYTLSGDELKWCLTQPGKER